MSTEHPHEQKGDCSSILDRLYEYIDDEMADDDCATIQQHLDDCAPCLAEYGLEQAVKSLVHRSCGCDTAPEQLRLKILTKIRQAQGGVAVDSGGRPAIS
jgi:mycothiol system anti-sigma-R factor